MSQPLLEVEGLCVGLGERGTGAAIVQGIDLSLRSGETFALVGESGCGKSMTALALMRLLPAGIGIGGGRVRLQGEELLELPEPAMRRVRGGRCGMIFQEPMSSLNPVLKVGQQIAEAVRRHDRLKGGAVTARVVELLQAVGIPDPAGRAHDYPHQLSGGMKQRVMIAMALAGRPSLLIADEPTTALDVTIQAQVLRLLKGLQRNSGMTILLITHDLGVVAETADRLAVMYAGEIVETAPLRAFFRDPRHPYSRMLLKSLPDRRKPDERLAVIPGSVPSLADHFNGCRFLSRCDVSSRRCRSEMPAWRKMNEESGVRCLLHGENRLHPDNSSASQAGVQQSGERRPGNEKLLEVTGLKVYFPIRRGLFRRVIGQLRAVDGIDLSINKGRTLALVGESGCGKSTAGKGILQLIRPSGGKVCFEADELTRLKGESLRRRRAQMQIVFQDPLASMNPRMSVQAIIEEGMRAQGIYSKAQRALRVARLLDQVGLPAQAAQRYPHEFSGGQRQRICIARALAVEPKLLVCDEPTSALDVSVQAQILNLLKDLQHHLELSYLFITHDIASVAYLADEVAVMYLGRIVEQGRVEELLDNPAHPYTRALLSAVPVPDPDHQCSAIQLQGDMPSPLDPPSGCHFHPRCSLVGGRCLESYPDTQPLSASHQVRCHYAGEAGTQSRF
ncbi:MAG: ABC transporter ATP-binding protein [Candidatus Thiodiazotropha sp.]